MDVNLDALVEQMPELIVFYGSKLLLAIVIFFVGKWLAATVSNMFERMLQGRAIDPTVSHFTRTIIYYLLFAMVIVAALGQLGVQTASLVAIIGAAGLAVGLALQGTLSNFAAGVLLILLRPCKIGDYIEAGGAAGTVKEIAIFATTLLTPDNKTIIVANSSIMGSNIVNYSTQEERRIDLIIGVSYGADLALVKQTLRELAEAEGRVLKTRDVVIGVSELAESSVNLVFRPWVKSADFWPVRLALLEAVKLRFNALGIEIPFPQLDVHLEKAA